MPSFFLVSYSYSFSSKRSGSAMRDATKPATVTPVYRNPAILKELYLASCWYDITYITYNIYNMSKEKSGYTWESTLNLYHLPIILCFFCISLWRVSMWLYHVLPGYRPFPGISPGSSRCSLQQRTLYRPCFWRNTTCLWRSSRCSTKCQEIWVGEWCLYCFFLAGFQVFLVHDVSSLSSYSSCPEVETHGTYGGRLWQVIFSTFVGDWGIGVLIRRYLSPLIIYCILTWGFRFCFFFVGVFPQLKFSSFSVPQKMYCPTSFVHNAWSFSNRTS